MYQGLKLTEVPSDNKARCGGDRKDYYPLIMVDTVDVISIQSGDTEGRINKLVFIVELTLIFKALLCRIQKY